MELSYADFSASQQLRGCRARCQGAVWHDKGLQLQPLCLVPPCLHAWLRLRARNALLGLGWCSLFGVSCPNALAVLCELPYVCSSQRPRSTVTDILVFCILNTCSIYIWCTKVTSNLLQYKGVCLHCRRLHDASFTDVELNCPWD